jgi:hypothetical protein
MSLVRGGPVHRLQGRLGLLADDGLPTMRCGLLVVALAWLPLAGLAMLDGRNFNFELGSGFYTDLSAYARFVLAAFVLIVTDRVTDNRLNRLLAGFGHSGIVGPETHSRFLAVLAKADDRSGSSRAELVMLLAAFIVAALSTRHALQINPASWMGASRGMPGPLSPAGWWMLIVSLPIFLVLVFRWLWRFGVWTVLLKDIAGLPLRLVATHPDKSGGLGFLTLFPVMFVPLAFSLSAVIASQALQEVLFHDAAFAQLRAAAIVWIVLVLLIFVGPLAVFRRKLVQLREQAILDYGELVARHNRRAEREFHADDADDRLLDSGTISGVADIAAGLDTIYAMRSLPVQLWAVIPLALAAAVPMIAVAAVQVPIQTLLQRILGALL